MSTERYIAKGKGISLLPDPHFSHEVGHHPTTLPSPTSHPFVDATRILTARLPSKHCFSLLCLSLRLNHPRNHHGSVTGTSRSARHAHKLKRKAQNPEHGNQKVRESITPLAVHERVDHLANSPQYQCQHRTRCLLAHTHCLPI